MKRIIKMKGETLTNQKETNRAIKAAVDQAKKVRTHCASCGCLPKPDEWSHVTNYCIDCA
jgi:recombinational DNA repair protein RecR